MCVQKRMGSSPLHTAAGCCSTQRHLPSVEQHSSCEWHQLSCFVFTHLWGQRDRSGRSNGCSRTILNNASPKPSACRVSRSSPSCICVSVCSSWLSMLRRNSSNSSGLPASSRIGARRLRAAERARRRSSARTACSRSLSNSVPFQQRSPAIQAQVQRLGQRWLKRTAATDPRSRIRRDGRLASGSCYLPSPKSASHAAHRP